MAVGRKFITGYRKVRRKALKLEEKIRRKATRTAVNKATTPISRSVRKLARKNKRTGEHYKSITKERAKTKPNGETAARVYSRSRMAHWLEYGTKPHMIRSRYGKLMTFTIRGKEVTAHAVKHPGAKPSPAFKPGLETNRKKSRDIYVREIAKAIRKETVRSKRR